MFYCLSNNVLRGNFIRTLLIGKKLNTWKVTTVDNTNKLLIANCAVNNDLSIIAQAMYI